MSSLLREANIPLKPPAYTVQPLLYRLTGIEGIQATSCTMTTFVRSCAIVIINHSKQDFRVNGSDLSLNVCSFARPTFRDPGESPAQRPLDICSGC
jgi:hypothetical protein